MEKRLSLHKFHERFFNNELPLELVIFNIITLCGMVGGFLSLPVKHSRFSMPLLQIIAILISLGFAFVALYIANFKGKLRFAAIMLTYSVTIILFPVFFFTGGGLESGIGSWFLLGMLFSVMLLDGIDFFLMILLDSVVIIICYLTQHYHPEFIAPLNDRKAVIIDTVFTLFIAFFAIGFVVYYQRRVYQRIQDATENANDDLVMMTVQAQKAQEDAVRSSEAKSTFLSNMSHEIRTPINNIVGMNEMILRETSDAKVEEYALDIQRSSQSLMRLLNEIMDISFIEQGRMLVDENEYSFVEFIYDIVSGTKFKIKDKKFDFITSIAANIPVKLIGDDLKLRQVLDNILNNAVKFTTDGSVTLSVSCVREDDNVAEMTFSVADTGVGIKPADLERVFNSYESTDITRGRGEGAGLGMTISQSLVKLMGGEIQVSSTYGKGSTFFFTVRQKIADVEPIGDYENRVNNLSYSYEHANSFIAPDAKILVVDDNAMNRKVFGSLLREMEVQIREAASGMEAIALVQEEHYDIIFLDHMMPAMDGVETLEKMQELDGNMCKDVPVVALTANAISGAKEMYLELGFNDYLSKPIVPEQLNKLIKQYLSEDLMIPDNRMPAEKKVKAKPEKDEDLPDIEGIDWNYAMTHFPNAALVKETAVDFAKSIDTEIEALETLMDDLDEYRIRVHAVKSSANTIGATTVGGLAKILEFAARDGRKDKIQSLNPVLVDEMYNLNEKMQILFEEDDSEKPVMEDLDDLNALLEMLKMNILSDNQDGTDDMMRQINGYTYAEKYYVTTLRKLDGCIRRLMNDEALDIIKDIQRYIEN